MKEVDIQIETDKVHATYFQSVSNTVHYWMELLFPTTARVLASYEHPQWGNYAAITQNQYGQGTATYLGCYFDDRSLLKALLRSVCEQAQIEVPENSYPVVIKRGTNDLGKEIIYYFNYSDTPCTVTYHGKEAALLLHSKTASVNAVSVSEGTALSLQDWDFVVLETL